jgi:peptidoglycan-associated lipoprotein
MPKRRGDFRGPVVYIKTSLPESSLMRPSLQLSLVLIAATSLVGVGCAKKKPAVTAPRPTVTAGADRARLDSIERAASERRAAEERARLEAERKAAREAVIQSLTAPVYFELDQADLTDEGRQTLDEKREAMQLNPSIRIRIEGHADDTGSDEYNMALGERRAATARRYLVQGGIAEGRMQIVSRGEEMPACPSREESCRSRNRRDEFIVLSGL